MVDILRCILHTVTARHSALLDDLLHTADRFWNAVRGNSTAYFLMTFLPEAGFIAACAYVIRVLKPFDNNDIRKAQQSANDGDVEGVRLTETRDR